jgi:hypothetical protein
LDALVASPEHHTLLFENERVPRPRLENVDKTEIHLLAMKLEDV